MAKLNVFKLLFLGKFFVAFIFLFLMLITPTRTALGFIYFMWGTAVLFWIFISLALEKLYENELKHDSEGFFIANFIDTTLAEESEEKYWLTPYLSVKYLLIVSLIVGFVWGAMYFSSVAFTSRGLLFVPNTFAVSPLTAGSMQVYDIAVSSFAVADVEEIFFSGLMFPTIWSVFAFIVFKGTKNVKLSFMFTFIFAILLTGFIASYWFHAFVFPVGYQQAYDFTFLHFSASAGMAGITGNIGAGIVAHAMHNFAVKLYASRGSFQVSPALQAYFIPVLPVEDQNSV